MAKRKLSKPRTRKPPNPVGILSTVNWELSSSIHCEVSLRDWFAGEALCGACCVAMVDLPQGEIECKNLATDLYKLADAMLTAREKGKKK